MVLGCCLKVGRCAEDVPGMGAAAHLEVEGGEAQALLQLVAHTAHEGSLLAQAATLVWLRKRSTNQKVVHGFTGCLPRYTVCGGAHNHAG